MFLGELTGSYQVLERGEAPKGLFTLDAYAGVRVYSVEVELTTTLASPEHSETGVDPIVGFDARFGTHKWLFLARADIGGFEVSSELTWSVMLGVAFRCSKLISLAAGYRWLDYDFETDGTGVTDLQLAGPFFALAFTCLTRGGPGGPRPPRPPGPSRGGGGGCVAPPRSPPWSGAPSGPT